MIHCFKCSSDLPDNMIYCLQCGALLDGEYETVVKSPQPEITILSPPSEMSLPVRATIAIFLVAAAAWMIIPTGFFRGTSSVQPGIINAMNTTSRNTTTQTPVVIQTQQPRMPKVQPVNAEVQSAVNAARAAAVNVANVARPITNTMFR